MKLSPWRAAALALSVGLGLLLAACTPRATPTPSEPAEEEKVDGPVWFEDATDALGLDFVHDAGPTGTYFMPQSMASGCAFFHDGDDGPLCIYLLQNGGPDSKSVNRLYRQQPDGTFKDATVDSGLDVTGFSMGVAIADVDNDGLPDVLLTQFGGVHLFLNKGNGHFDDVTVASGLSNKGWGASAAFLDYNQDGLLDLVLVNYVDYNPKSDCFSPRGSKDYCGPTGLPGTCAKLFRNLGPKPGERVPRFEDVSFAAGLGQLPGPGLGVFCADFDGDGWQDIFVANDGAPNRLWMNRPDGKGGRHFVDEAVRRNVAFTSTGKAYAGMGVAVGDVNNDGLFDLYVTHLGYETNTLWVQKPRGQFRDRTVEAGLTNMGWRGTGFGTLMADFNLDGSPDIAVVNGRVLAGGPAKDTGLGYWETYAERNQLFANDGTGKFRDVSPSNKAFCGHWNVARGLACADVNDDGAPDLLVTTAGSRARLFRNIAPNRGHWLKVRAVIPELKRDAYGAEVTVRAGGVDRLRLISPAESFLSSSSPVGLFGLGKADTVESILVKWPSGEPRVERFEGGPADRSIVVRQGKGKQP